MNGSYSTGPFTYLFNSLLQPALIRNGRTQGRPVQGRRGEETSRGLSPSYNIRPHPSIPAPSSRRCYRTPRLPRLTQAAWTREARHGCGESRGRSWAWRLVLPIFLDVIVLRLVLLSAKHTPPVRRGRAAKSFAVFVRNIVHLGKFQGNSDREWSSTQRLNSKEMEPFITEAGSGSYPVVPSLTQVEVKVDVNKEGKQGR